MDKEKSIYTSPEIAVITVDAESAILQGSGTSGPDGTPIDRPW